MHAFCMASFRLGIWTGPFLVGDMDWPLAGWGYGPAPFQLGIWIGRACILLVGTESREGNWPFQLRIPTQKPALFMSGTKGRSEAAWCQSIACVCEYLNHVVQEFRWADKLNPFNHCPNFPFFMTHFMDSMPISSVCGI